LAYTKKTKQKTRNNIQHWLLPRKQIKQETTHSIGLYQENDEKKFDPKTKYVSSKLNA
jgi:hypothetical protein